MVEEFEESFAVGQVLHWFTGCLSFGNTNPFDEVVVLPSVVEGVQDGFHFILILVIDDDRGWGWDGSVGESVGGVGLQERNVENWVNLHCGREVEFEGNRIDFLEDGKGPEFLEVELVGWAGGLDMAPK